MGHCKSQQLDLHAPVSGGSVAENLRGGGGRSGGHKGEDGKTQEETDRKPRRQSLRDGQQTERDM